MAIILLCVAVIALATPTPPPWGNRIALVLAIIALIFYCVGLRGGHLVSRDKSPAVVDSAPLLSGLGAGTYRLRPDGSRVDDVPIVIS